MTYKIEPMFNQILIEPVQKKQVLVQESPSLTEYGKVVAVGPDVKTIKEGDLIAFLLWGVNWLEIEGVKHHFISETSEFILGKIIDANQ